jgi:hypothetical protein
MSQILRYLKVFPWSYWVPDNDIMIFDCVCTFTQFALIQYPPEIYINVIYDLLPTYIDAVGIYKFLPKTYLTPLACLN